jgi:hypothetical protein
MWMIEIVQYISFRATPSDPTGFSMIPHGGPIGNIFGECSPIFVAVCEEYVFFDTACFAEFLRRKAYIGFP